MFAQCPCGKKIAITGESIGRTVECPNCRQPRALVLSQRFVEDDPTAGASFREFEILGACLMWMVALTSVAAVVLLH